MKNNKYSHTAEGAAAMRAAGCYEKKAYPNPDNLSEKLISKKYQVVVKNPLLRKLVLAIYNYRLPGMYEAHLCRTHHFDYIINKELNEGATQLLILGAGLDTRPYRFKQFSYRVHFFEVDHPATSKFKQKRLAEANIDFKHVTFVPVNFTSESAEDKLIFKGFDKLKRTIVLWEGVIMYLSSSIVSKVLKFIASLEIQSSILFDYVYPSFYETPHIYKNAQKHLRYVNKAGEPYTFGLNYDQIENYVNQYDLKLLSNDAKTMNQQYLSGYNMSVTPWYALAHCSNC